MQKNNMKTARVEHFEAVWSGKLSYLDQLMTGLNTSFRKHGVSEPFVSQFIVLAKKVNEMQYNMGELKFYLKLQKPPPAKYDGEQMELEQ